MKISRRRLLQGGALTGATMAIPGPLQRALFAPNQARASGVGEPILVMVQLGGGNDGLNTVIPVNDGPVYPQRTEYDLARDTIAIDPADLGPTTIGLDPEKDNTLALHPALIELKAMFDAGKVAVIQGVAYEDQNLSHFRSEDIWFDGERVAPFSDGWFGRYLEAHYPAVFPDPAPLVTVDVDGTLSKMFVCQGGCNVLAVKKLSQFELPDDPVAPDAAAKKAALEAAYAVEADPAATSGLQNTVGGSGKILLDKIEEYEQIDTNWGSNLGGVSGSLAKRLTEVASIIRHDVLPTTTPVGARYFHVRLGGFDTHTNQGGLTGRQASLFRQLSQSLSAFYQDLADIDAAEGSNLAERTLAVTFSEFGRRVAENGGGGTDHGCGSVLFAVGDCVNGGIYGTMPDIGDPDSRGNLKHGYDFRQVYSTILANWLGVSPDPLLPESPHAPIAFV